MTLHASPAARISSLPLEDFGSRPGFSPRAWNSRTRHVGRMLFIAATVLTCLLGSERMGQAETPQRPNIILCMADDLGYGDTSYNGHPVLKTPNLDAMAAAGLRFNRFYAASAVCSPTRGSCLTGRHPSRYGITTANAGHLKQQEVCLAEVLRERGYATGHFGKWHLGTMTPDFSGKGAGRKPRQNYMTPGMAGFDEWFSTEYAVSTWDPYDPKNAHGKYDVRALYWHNGKNIADGEQAGLTGCDSRIVMDHALPFVEKAARDKQPFFAVIWFHAPHEPVRGGPEYLARFAEHPEKERHYYAVVTALDDQLGRLRSRLRELGVADNTMLWFASDNGPEHATGPGTTAGLRGRKRSLYEGGVRVPGIVEWPAKIKQPRTTDVPAVTSDYFPTVLEAVGASTSAGSQQKHVAAGRPSDGLSLLPLFEGKAQRRAEPIAFQYQKQATLIDNQYKLVTDPGLKKLELYDIAADPAEKQNIASAHPDVAAAMRQRLESWLQSCAASNQGEDYGRPTR